MENASASMIALLIILSVAVSLAFSVAVGLIQVKVQRGSFRKLERQILQGIMRWKKNNRIK